MRFVQSCAQAHLFFSGGPEKNVGQHCALGGGYHLVAIFLDSRSILLGEALSELAPFSHHNRRRASYLNMKTRW